MWDWFNTNQGTVLAVTNIVLVLCTISLALDSKRAADVSLKQLALVSQPYLAIQKDMLRRWDPVDKKGLTDKFRDMFRFENVGQVLINFKIDNVKLNDQEVPVLNKDLQYLLFPKLTFDYWFDLKFSQPVNPELALNKIDIKIIFWANNLPEKKYSLNRECTFDSKTTNIFHEEVNEIK